MESVLTGVLNFVTTRKQEDKGDKQLITEIESVKQSIEMAASRFDFQSDPDLVEACIYEMQALAARYRYLRREARRQGITQNSVLCLKHLD